MKKNMLLLLGILAIVSLVLPYAVESLSAPQISITLMSQEPDPVGPGEYVDIRLKIENSGSETAEDMTLQLDPEFPFTLDPNEDAERNLGNIPPTGSTKSTNIVIVKYKIKVDNDAVEGINELKFNYQIKDSQWFSETFDIDVNTQDATLSIEQVKTSPEKIKPGEEAQVQVKVKNMADSVLKDVSVKLDLTFQTFASQLSATTSPLSAYDSLPFAPINSATEKKIQKINSGDEVLFTFDILAYSTAESRVYKIPIQIIYYDEIGTEYIKNDIIGIVVGTKPDLSVVLESSELYQGKPIGEVAIKIVNKGFSDVKFLNVRLDETDDYELLSPGEVYIGNVDSDDYESAEFNIYCKDACVPEESGEDMMIVLPVTVEYKDANGMEYSDVYDLEMKLYDPQKLGVGSNNNVTTGVLFVIALIVVFVVYRRIRKKKR